MSFERMCGLAVLGVMLAVVMVAEGQRVAPGVPPQHYQPPPPQHQVPVQQQVPMQHVPMQQQVPLQQQHVPVQQQHVPVQQQHVPVQQQHVPVQQQHVPVQQQHVPVQQQQMHHGHHAQGQPLLNTANIAQEKQHIQEHMEVPIDTSKMSEQELQFHYFKMHDADNNNKLDGSELIKSLIHWHEQGHHDPNNPTPQGEKIFTDEELFQLIDPILNMDDTNRDGYIDYPEFVRAQHKAAVNSKQP